MVPPNFYAYHLQVPLNFQVLTGFGSKTWGGAPLAVTPVTPVLNLRPPRPAVTPPRLPTCTRAASSRARPTGWPRCAPSTGHSAHTQRPQRRQKSSAGRSLCSWQRQPRAQSGWTGAGASAVPLSIRSGNLSPFRSVAGWGKRGNRNLTWGEADDPALRGRLEGQWPRWRSMLGSA